MVVGKTTPEVLVFNSLPEWDKEVKMCTKEGIIEGLRAIYDLCSLESIISRMLKKAFHLHSILPVNHRLL